MTESDRSYDILVIGAGIIGATLARELSAYDMRVAVLDKASDIPSGASRANSAMVHAGYDDKPGTVKASFVAKGNKRYHELAGTLDFTLRECGSYVCGFEEADWRTLEKLQDYGKRNGVPGVEIVSGNVLRSKEPNLSDAIRSALWAPSGAIINNFEAVLAFMDNAQQNGVELFLETEVTGMLLSEKKDRIRGVETNRGDFYAPIVVNAAGVYSDVVARMAGDESFRIQPVRGEYFLFDKAAGNLVSSFLFTCPTEKGKGITISRTADGNLLIGPTAISQENRDVTPTTAEGLREVREGALQLIPSIPFNLTITSFAGLRASPESGDFHIGLLDSPRGFVNIGGIKSPGFTCAPAIALFVTESIREKLGDLVVFRKDPSFVPERKHIPRFEQLSMEERAALWEKDSRYGQIICRCEMVTEGQIMEAIRRGARTVAGIKIWTRAGAGRCQGGFCGPRVVDILARELHMSPEEITRHGGHSNLLVGKTKEYWFRSSAEKTAKKERQQ